MSETVSPVSTPVAPDRRSVLWHALSVCLALGAAVGSAWVWQQAHRSEQEAQRQRSETDIGLLQSREQIARTDAALQEMQNRLGLAEARLAEVVLQRTQLDEALAGLARAHDEGLRQELETLLQLAEQQAQVTGSAQPVLLALQALGQRLGRLAQPRWQTVQRAVQQDQERLAAQVVPDTAEVLARLDAWMPDIDRLPLANGVPGPEPLAPVASAGNEPLAVGASWQAHVAQAWARLWDALAEQGRELVRVRRLDGPEAALLAPDQAFFLRENAKSRLQVLRWAVLARQTASARQEIQTLSAWLTRYFDPQAASTQALLNGLATLSNGLSDAPLPRASQTVAALAALPH